MDRCAICRRLEWSYPALLDKRRDVLIRKVHFPDGGLNFTFNGDSADAVQREIIASKEKIESYRVCGTPHVEVFGPDRQPLARDNCGDKRGLACLRNWINREFGRRTSSI